MGLFRVCVGRTESPSSSFRRTGLDDLHSFLHFRFERRGTDLWLCGLYFSGFCAPFRCLVRLGYGAFGAADSFIPFNLRFCSNLSLTSFLSLSVTVTNFHPGL